MNDEYIIYKTVLAICRIWIRDPKSATQAAKRSTRAIVSKLPNVEFNPARDTVTEKMILEIIEKVLSSGARRVTYRDLCRVNRTVRAEPSEAICALVDGLVARGALVRCLNRKSDTLFTVTLPSP